MSEPLNRDEMEVRRLAAAQDLLAGLNQSAVARKFGVSRTTTGRWKRALRKKGIESLKKGRATGRPCWLTKEQLLMIPVIFEQNNCCTIKHLASAIEENFGVRYNHDHVGRIMQKLGLATPGMLRLTRTKENRESSDLDL